MPLQLQQQQTVFNYDSQQTLTSVVVFFSFAVSCCCCFDAAASFSSSSTSPTLFNLLNWRFLFVLFFQPLLLWMAFNSNHTHNHLFTQIHTRSSIHTHKTHTHSHTSSTFSGEPYVRSRMARCCSSISSTIIPTTFQTLTGSCCSLYSEYTLFLPSQRTFFCFFFPSTAIKLSKFYLLFLVFRFLFLFSCFLVWFAFSTLRTMTTIFIIVMVAVVVALRDSVCRRARDGWLRLL